MNLTEGILIVVIIILILVVVTRGKQMGNGPNTTREWDCTDRKTGDTTSVKMQYSGSGLCTTHGKGCKCPKCSSPESDTVKEHMEYFSAGCDEESKLALQSSCAGNDFAYATNDFGAPGLSYKDWITSQAVDAQTITNHSQFVQDRLGLAGATQTITGRTWAVPEAPEVMQIPYVGLRKPQSVPMCNPTQVADVDYDWYDTKPKFNWTSS